MSGTVKGIIVEIGGDTSGLQKALSKINSASSGLSKELRGINSLLKLDPSNTVLVSQKQEILAENIAKTEDKIKSLKEAQEQADKIMAEGGEINQENYRALQREIIATQNKLSALKAEASNWNKAGDALIKYGERITAISQKIETIGTNLATKITLPLVALAGASVNSAMEFETAFTGVEKTVNGTAEQLEELKKGIKDMSEELPSSTTEIAAVAEAAGQLGIQTENILGFSKAMIDLGNSTNLTADEAASQLAKFANIMQMSQQDFDKLGSSIVDLGNNFATTEADIVDMSMRLAGAGKQVGLSEGEVLGLATALSSVGIEAEMGGSAISKAMVKMQSAVEVGGGKLNDTLKKTGKSLRDLELMSANDSKGFKELSQSVGLTSTELKQMITAGANLEDFAKVSGMSAEEFKKAWKDDAAGALSAFIKGLGDAESKGDSAITMLTEMGLTEVRLRDSLLRAANAGDLFNNAIETGTKAWDENTALTNEANKRYETLASKVQITKNKLSNLATNMGNKMTPTVSKMLDKVDDLIDSFDDLTEEETLNIIKTVAFVAGIGPALTILGKLGTKLGTTATTLGNFSKAIANVKNGVKTAEGQVGTFTNILSKLTSPAGIATIAIGALTAASIYYANKQQESLKQAQEYNKTIEDSKKAFDDYNKSIENTANSEMGHLNHITELKNELSQIVDENGKVKEGYEGRVSFILNELNKALGTEYKLNENVIESYQELQGSVDELVRKKKAEIALSAEEEQYANATKERTKAVQELTEIQEKMGGTYENSKKKYDDWIQSIHEAAEAHNAEAMSLAASKQQEMNTLKEYLDAYETQESVVKDCIEKQKQYESDYALFAEGKYDEVGKSIIDSTKTWSDSSINTIRGSIISQKQELTRYKEIYERTGDEIAKQSMDQAQQNLQNLASELSARTKTIGDLGEDEIRAWKALAIQSNEIYSQEIAKMSPEMQAEIQRVTGVIAGDKTIQYENGMMAQRATSEFHEKAKQMPIDMQSEVTDTSDVLNTDTTLEDAAETVGRNVETGFTSQLDGTQWAIDMISLFTGSLTGKWAYSVISGAASKAAGWIRDKLGFSVPKDGPLSDADTYMPDMVDLLSSTMLKSSPKLEKATNNVAKMMASNLDLSKYQSALNAQVINSTKTVFTTPQIVFNVQELDEVKLQQCFNYINKKFGSKY